MLHHIQISLAGAKQYQDRLKGLRLAALKINKWACAGWVREIWVEMALSNRALAVSLSLIGMRCSTIMLGPDSTVLLKDFKIQTITTLLLWKRHQAHLCMPYPPPASPSLLAKCGTTLACVLRSIPLWAVVLLVLLFGALRRRISALLFGPPSPPAKKKP